VFVSSRRASPILGDQRFPSSLRELELQDGDNGGAPLLVMGGALGEVAPDATEAFDQVGVPDPAPIFCRAVDPGNEKFKGALRVAAGQRFFQKTENLGPKGRFLDRSKAHRPKEARDRGIRKAFLRELRGDRLPLWALIGPGEAEFAADWPECRHGYRNVSAAGQGADPVKERLAQVRERERRGEPFDLHNLDQAVPLVDVQVFVSLRVVLPLLAAGR
jgi:hypothetical protein